MNASLYAVVVQLPRLPKQLIKPTGKILDIWLCLVDLWKKEAALSIHLSRPLKSCFFIQKRARNGIIFASQLRNLKPHGRSRGSWGEVHLQVLSSFFELYTHRKSDQGAGWRGIFAGLNNRVIGMVRWTESQLTIWPFWILLFWKRHYGMPRGQIHLCRTAVI